MGSYNRINGIYACENPHTLTEILRQELGFQGWVMSDFMATQSTAGSANAGLDWELGLKWWGPRLLEAVQAGEVRTETIDEMVRRIVRPALALGLSDHAMENRAEPTRFHGEAARTIAETGDRAAEQRESALPPLSLAELRSIAVIGPDADNTSAAGGGSALVQAPDGVSVLEGVRRRAGKDIRVDYAPGVDTRSGRGCCRQGFLQFHRRSSGRPERRQASEACAPKYWDNVGFEGRPRIVRIEPGVALNRGFFDFLGLKCGQPKAASHSQADLGPHFSARWTGALTAPAGGEYICR